MTNSFALNINFVFVVMTKKSDVNVNKPPQILSGPVYDLSKVTGWLNFGYYARECEF